MLWVYFQTIFNWLCHTKFSQVAVNSSLFHLVKLSKNLYQLVRNQMEKSIIHKTAVPVLQLVLQGWSSPPHPNSKLHDSTPEPKRRKRNEPAPMPLPARHSMFSHRKKMEMDKGPNFARLSWFLFLGGGGLWEDLVKFAKNTPAFFRATTALPNHWLVQG